MNPAFWTVLEGAVDFAGLFPPAALSMGDAVAAWADYARSGDRWALGRFVVPAASLDAFVAEAERLRLADDEPWPLSVLVGADPAADLARVDAAERRAGGGVRVEALEVRPASPEGVTAIAEALRNAGRDALETYVEMPLGDGRLGAWLDTVSAAGLRAKARTGGVEAAAFPDVESLAAFVVGCARAGLRFKATAGLHHPLRGRYRLTYAPDSDAGDMYGFVNLAVATALAAEGAGEGEVGAALVEDDPDAFVADGDGLVWRGRRVSGATLAAARTQGMTGFGSCSFREPVDELAEWATAQAAQGGGR